MILFNSIFKKQNMKTLMLIYTLSILIIYYLITIKDFYIAAYNNVYKNSFLEVKYVTTDGVIERISKIKNIQNIKEGILLNYENQKYFFTENKELEEKKIILSKKYQNFYHYNSLFKLQDNSYLVGAFNSNIYNDEIQVSSKIYDELFLENPKTLRIELKDWSLKSLTETYIEQQLNLDVNSFTPQEPPSYKFIIHFYTIFTYEIMLFFMMYLIISLFTVIRKEKPIIKFLHKIGFSKNNIIALYSVKILSLFLVSSTISFSFIFFINNFPS